MKKNNLPNNIEENKPKDMKKTLKRLLGYLGIHKFAVIFAFFMTIGSSLIYVVGPTVLGLITTSLGDTVMERVNGNPGALVNYGYIQKIIGILLVLYIVQSVFSYFQHYTMGAVTQRIVYNIRKEMDAKLKKLPLKYYDNNKTGDILSRVVNDVYNISNTLQQSLTQLMTAAIEIVGVVVMMLLINPFLTIIAFVTIPLSMLAVRKITAFSQKNFKEQQKKLGDLNAHSEEMYGAHVVVTAYGLEKESIEEFEKTNDELKSASMKANFASGLIMPIMNFITNLGYVAVAVLGGYFVLNGTIKIGQMQAFMQYSRSFMEPIIQIADITNIIQSTIASAERVFEVLDEPVEEDLGKLTLNPENVKGNVKFKNVDFGYEPGELLIKDMNIEAKPAQMVAVVGPTGAGKSTLINLLMRFYELNSGEISIDGINIVDLKRGSLHRNFGMVLQDTWLFKGTIRENIAYGREDATDEMVEAAARVAQADYFIRTLPEGYDTIINEEASNISQGQKQLLTIARAFLAETNMLILDEATSSVDTRTEKLIQKAMDNLMNGKTSFVIAHRLSTIVNADLILVMKDGSIIEQGNHEQLMLDGGFYADLYNSQFQD